MDRIARTVTPGLVSIALVVAGLALVVVAVGGSPLPWWAAVATAACELLGAGYVVGRNAEPAGDVAERPKVRAVA